MLMLEQGKIYANATLRQDTASIRFTFGAAAMSEQPSAPIRVQRVTAAPEGFAIVLEETVD